MSKPHAGSTSAAWQPPAASAQYLNPGNAKPSQSHLRPGADIIHEPRDLPDKMLINFLRSNESYEVTQSSDPQEPRKTSQGLLKEILNDDRWTRRMVEDFYNTINPSVGGLGSCLTPYPVHRTLYLVLLNALEDNDKSKGEEDGRGIEGPAGFAKAGSEELDRLEKNKLVQGPGGRLDDQP